MLKATALALALLSLVQVSDDGTPATSNVRGAQYPRVHADGRITFRVTARNAQKVQIQAGTPEGMGGGPFDMTKSGDGIWTVTTPPAVPGFHYYWLLVDGFNANDPSSDTFYGYNRPTSGIEVPERGVDFYLPKSVPHGDVRQHWYLSKVTGAWRRAFVYVPPGYDASRSRYPVLYLQHGAGENEEGWTKQGRVNFILDNLIAEKKATPMIIVMDNGYATRAGATVPVPGAPPAPPVSPAPSSAFEEVLLKDIIPSIDTAFRTRADRGNRALAGLSMGAGQALTIGLAHLETFSAIAAFSRPPARAFDLKTAYNGVFADAAAFNKKVPVFFWSAGTAETQFYDSAKANMQTLVDAGVKGAFYASPGTAHEWHTWRRSMLEFAPKLFR